MEAIILDLGWGNLNAMQQFFVKMGYHSKVKRPEVNQPVITSDKYICIIPGVGSASQFDKVSTPVRKNVTQIIDNASFTIGICLGAHFLTTRTGECDGLGLNLFDAYVHKIKNKFEIGYRNVVFDGHKFPIYHCHSYYIPESQKTISTGKLADNVTYSQLIIDGKICLIQGHPEKSGLAGERLVRNILGGRCI